MRRKRKPLPTQLEVKEAIAKFIKLGGLIKKLPNQPNGVRINYLSCRGGSPFESLQELLAEPIIY
ncbi:MAG TPA: hypothetical protein ENI23_05485 [bacterium]|nr:hypothetical protein [bacterium]